MNSVDLSQYDNSWYNPGGFFKRTLWYFTNIIFFINPLNPSSGIKKKLLKLFGAKIEKGVVIKPGVNIKYPWKLSIGENTWIGENVWIDNLDNVRIGKNCCLSQGVLILCGNHDYKKPTFDLIIGTIIFEDGVWIGAQSTVTLNSICKSHSVLATQSVLSGTMDAYSIYRGNPATKTRDRVIN
ncbi:WcaF family extracellular polysaccharide biosynthesis acetyltransferase [Plebeiibacterium marinum]|uniref:WcaF family extracellular polysaccharide biosynthesis acetyltransferase n=1 Tax=Plebeiibacterium marinum TaxID=2992111 RepID=A0AAE3SJ18_9BACT|nr:WcaF family extracellular polysaccharide biosynthesis acetyltransferase [Plebeiobacterium marinum]MCW3804954.1 WcaF family extracellular polysaccharide biosynthesis acetyltransferase [Plebeiobacterium marinum]